MLYELERVDSTCIAGVVESVFTLFAGMRGGGDSDNMKSLSPFGSAVRMSEKILD